tara:strand:- start:37714 stop:38064 length:351 start_codon:yes stop_codon:yes gene_type:complete
MLDNSMDMLAIYEACCKMELSGQMEEDLNVAWSIISYGITEKDLSEDRIFRLGIGVVMLLSSNHRVETESLSLSLKELELSTAPYSVYNRISQDEENTVTYPLLDWWLSHKGKRNG